MNNWEWEPWLYEFKKQYGGHPALSYTTLKYLLESWNNAETPAKAVERIRAAMEATCSPTTN